MIVKGKESPMTKSGKIHVMISSRCKSQISYKGKLVWVTEVRTELEKQINLLILWRMWKSLNAPLRESASLLRLPMKMGRRSRDLSGFGTRLRPSNCDHALKGEHKHDKPKSSHTRTSICTSGNKELFTPFVARSLGSLSLRVSRARRKQQLPLR